MGGVYSITPDGFTLNISNVSGLNGKKYRFVATNTLGASDVRYATSNSATLFVSPATCTLAVTGYGRTTLTLNATSATNTRVLIIASAVNSFTWTPTDGNTDYKELVNGVLTVRPYVDSLVFMKGYPNLPAPNEVTNSNYYVVYDGPATSNIIVSGLTRTKKYYFRAFAYNGIVEEPSTYAYNRSYASASGTTSSKDAEEMLPGEKEFSGNFSISTVKPNPVSTDINFNINANEADNYTIELFDMNGELVINQSQMLNAGDHSMKLDLVNQKGRISAGTYFLKVTASNESQTQKVVVLP